MTEQSPPPSSESQQTPPSTDDLVDSPKFRRRYGKRFWVLLFVTLAVGLWVFNTFRTPDLKPVVVSVDQPPIITVEQTTVDLGTVETDSKVSQTFDIFNEGGEDLEILGVEPSCGCTVANLTEKIIKPGAHTSLEITLDTSIKLGDVVKTIDVKSNDPKQPVLTLTLTGNVIRTMAGHNGEPVPVKDPLVLFKGKCAECHVNHGVGKTGKALFAADCGMCHGMRGQGNVAMPLIYGNYNNEEYVANIRAIIVEGSPNTPTMPPFHETHGGPLNDDQIDSLLSYLKYEAEQQKEAPAPAPASSPSTPKNQ